MPVLGTGFFFGYSISPQTLTARSFAQARQNTQVAIPQSFIQELLSRVDVVDIVGRYVQLKKGGANFMGLCPFHGEKSPSFTVSPSKQFFHCFGCGKNGNAIGFLMEHAGMGFVEAVQDLANQVGLQVPQDDISPAERERQAQQKQKQATLTDVLEKAGDSYRKQLKTAQHAIDYLKKRGVSGEVCKRFGLGYAPAGWHGLASVFPEYDNPQLEESGLVIVSEEDKRRYDRFRDRLMFPIRNVKGECIGFGGRVFGDEKPKYLNSPETPVFHKGRELYGLFEARQALRDMGYALVTEGYMDVVALAQLGFANAVATLGTACTPDHVQKLFRFTEAVVFSFDGDGAGRRAARKALDAALPLATDTRSIKFLFLPAEHDPDSFIREFGSEAFARYVGDATPLSRFLIEAASDGCDLGQTEGRAHMASNARPLWSLLPDGVLKRQLLSEIAALAQLDSRDLSEIWAKEAARTAPARPRTAATPAHDAPPLGEQPPAWDAPPAWEHGGSWSDMGGLSAPAPDYPPSGYSQGGFSNHSAPQGAGQNAYGQSSGWRGNRQQGFGRDKKPWGRNKGSEWNPPPLGPRVTPGTRTDQAARLLMAHMEFMEELTHEDFDALTHSTEAHGALFRWLEAQFTESGPRSWAVLREQLKGLPQQPLAEKLMNSVHAQPEGELDELRVELRGVLNRILIEHIKQQITQTIQSMSTDPSATQRLRDLYARQQTLDQQMRNLPSSS
ncbi:DNA primase [Comamonas aquatilis]